jgi:hypothetical protein
VEHFPYGVPSLQGEVSIAAAIENRAKKAKIAKSAFISHRLAQNSVMSNKSFPIMRFS